MSDDALHTVFVYGTLRLGATLWHRIHKQVTAVVGDVVVPGTMYRSPMGYGYPVVNFDEISGEVIGDVITVDSRAMNWIDWMETSSGYEPRLLTVTLPTGEVTATAYHWPHLDRGERIADGDWTVHDLLLG